MYLINKQLAETKMKHAAGRICLILIIFALFGCNQSTEPDKTAKYFTIDELSRTPGYYWFDIEYNAYNPDNSIIQGIKNAFEPDKHRFFFFMRPACSCAEPQKPFVHLIKSLREADIADSNIEIYSMDEVDYEHPYTSNFTLSTLPTYFVINIADTLPVYSLSDTLEYIKQVDPFKYDTLKVEELLLEALTQ